MDSSHSPQSDNQQSSSVSSKKILTSRRDFLKGFAVAATASAVPMAALASHAENASNAHSAIPSELDTRKRRVEAFRRRFDAAATDRKIPVPSQSGNGDEALFPNGIASFTKGFPHNQYGEVDPTAYQQYQLAIHTGVSADFDAISMGGTVPLVDPQAGLAFDLEGVDVAQLSLPAAPAFSSPERAAEAVEVYWMALARDVDFSQYDSNATTQAAAAELSGLPAFEGPRASGQVTTQTLFRGFTAADQVGPFVSQLLLQPFSYGAIPFAGYKTDLPLNNGGADFMITEASWLNCQNGGAPFPAEHPDTTLRYMRAGRDLAAYVHVDVLFEAYLNAALALLTMNAPLNSGNPYNSLKSETGFITFGLPQVEVLIAEVGSRALKHAWFEKWFIHRIIRPEEFGGRIQFTRTGARNYPIDATALNSKAVQAAFERNGTYLLPMAYPEGCPQHPSYPQAHATIAGACATVLKWFFNETTPITNPVVASADGTTTVPYTGSDAGQMTVGGEINKLASNIALARMFAGVHWRTDYTEGLLLGEQAAISVLRDQRNLYNESFTGFTFTQFDGTQITV